MSEITFSNPNSEFVWKNLSDHPIHVTCEGLIDETVAPNSGLRSQAFRAVNNTAAVMIFSTAGGTVSTCTIRWRTVADKFILTREDDSSDERVALMVRRDWPTYCIDLQVSADAPGIVIVGTIDTK
jgi:hypothetical protein